MNAPLMTAHHQWLSRPQAHRFTSLPQLRDSLQHTQDHSSEKTLSSRSIKFEPVGDDHKSLAIVSPGGHHYAPTHWSFGQLCSLVKAHASYLRTLPAELVSDCLNYSFGFSRDVEDVKLYLYSNGINVLRAANGPGYGRIYSAGVVQATMDILKTDGVNGDWRVPVEYGRREGVAPPEVTKQNTTIYGSDRDTWIFLADETKGGIEVKNRRQGKTGQVSRGVMIWNSEVGFKKIGCCKFGFDHMCGNHMIWGVRSFEKMEMRHTASAPDRWMEEFLPALKEYADGNLDSLAVAIDQARSRRLSGDKVDEFIAQRFGKRLVGTLKRLHEAEEFRPIENQYDVVTAVTALARGVEHIDERVTLEIEAGRLLVAA